MAYNYMQGKTWSSVTKLSMITYHKIENKMTNPAIGTPYYMYLNITGASNTIDNHKKFLPRDPSSQDT